MMQLRDLLVAPRVMGGHVPSLIILEVDSRKRVSLGDILWKTTFWIDDLPDRRSPIRMIRGLDSACAKVGGGREWRATARWGGVVERHRTRDAYHERGKRNTITGRLVGAGG